MVFAALKIAVFAPIPSARVSTAIAVNAGFFASIRIPYFKSCNRVPMRMLLHPRINSLVTQCLQRVHVRRAPRGEITSREGDDCQPRYYSGKRERVGCLYAIELALQIAHSDKGAGDSEHESNACETHSISHHHSQHVSWLSAERHADADLVRALRNGISHDA